MPSPRPTPPAPPVTSGQGSASSPGETLRIHSLDGLRGVLALFVCCYHLLNSLPEFKAWLAQYTALMGQGWVAVDIFFALSGFVMCYVYDKAFSTGVTFRDWGQFMWARFARLYPVHIVTLAIFFVLLVPFIYNSDAFLDPEGRYSFHSAIASIFLLQGPWVPHRTWNYPSWSISVEWHLYIVFPFLVALVRPRLVSLALLVLMPLLAVGVYTLLLHAGDGGAAMADYEPFPTNGPISLLRGFLMFFVGMALFNIRDMKVMSSPWAAGLVAAAFVVLLHFEQTAPYSVLLIAPLVLLSIQNATAMNVLSRPVPLFLGRISYSLYMVHAIVQVAIVNRLNGFADGQAPAQLGVAVGLLIVGVAISMALATLMHFKVELPCRTLLRNVQAPLFRRV